MNAKAIIIMGVAGSGKTTIGSMLAHELDWDFHDADDFHPPANREKMVKGVPLTDEDRADWLFMLRKLIFTNLKNDVPLVLACSALKQTYRDELAVDDKVRFVYLHGTYDQVETRMKRRKDHYMPVELLQSQFEALEEPRDAVIVDISNPPERIIQIIRKGINV